MTPELPRAPMRAPWAAACITADTECSETGDISCTLACMVRNMLVPVSPSGTGKTLSALTTGTCFSSHVMPAVSISFIPGPSAKSDPLRELLLVKLPSQATCGVRTLARYGAGGAASPHC